MKYAGTEDAMLWLKEVESGGELIERSEANTPNKLSKVINQSCDLKLKRYMREKDKWGEICGNRSCDFMAEGG